MEIVIDGFLVEYHEWMLFVHKNVLPVLLNRTTFCARSDLFMVDYLNNINSIGQEFWINRYKTEKKKMIRAFPIPVRFDLFNWKSINIAKSAMFITKTVFALHKSKNVLHKSLSLNIIQQRSNWKREKKN